MAEPPVGGRFLQRWLTHPLQAVGLALALALFRLLPIDWASGLGGLIGRTIGPYLSASRVARRNLARAFPEKPAEEIERIVRAMWDNLGRVAAEYPHLRALRAGIGERIEVVGADVIDALRDDQRPGIFFAAHLGNWEVAPHSAARRGLLVTTVFRAPDNPLVDAVLRRLRRPGGEHIAKGTGGARHAIKLLVAGGHLGLLVDQKLNDGIAVPFFGRDAMTAPALAQFALRFDCPVVPTRVERIAGARFRITVAPPIDIPRTGERQRDVFEITRRVNEILESWIRERPEQWLWAHKRWPD